MKMLITSLENEKIKNLAKLQKKKFRDETSTYLIEGEHLVEEAYKNEKIIEIIQEKGEKSYPGIETIEVTHEIMKKISTLEDPPKIMALCKKEETNEIKGEKILYLEEIQDPGNLGTIIRSSLSFNVDTIVLSPNCVDLYNPKVLRGTQGMILHINITTKKEEELLEYAKRKEIPLYATSVIEGTEAKNLTQEEKEKYCLIMGNEGSGLRKELLEKCDKKLYIKMNEKVESLNVGVATSILLYELGR